MVQLVLIVSEFVKHAGADEKIPAVKLTVHCPSPGSPTDDTQDPDCEVTAHDPPFEKYARSILSTPVELELTDPTNNGAGND